ncbi:MAG: lysophospholipid acyltransferase family protein [Myxococcales bacterium]
MPEPRPQLPIEIAPVEPAGSRVRPHIVERPTPSESTPPSAIRAIRRPRELSAVSLSPEEIKRIERHNARIGRPLQRATMRTVQRYLVGLFGGTLLRLFFRVRTRNLSRLQLLEQRSGIFAIRHFYEADPFVSFIAGGLPMSWRRPHYVSFALASRLWARNPVIRVFSWALGVMSLSRGLGLRQSATTRAIEILRGEELATVAIFPTGPIGKRPFFSLGPGVGFLGLSCPDVPVIPVTLQGVKEFRWRDVLLLRRPVLTLAICRPVYGREVPGDDEERRADAICDVIAQRWAEEERLVGDRATTEETRA